MKDKIIPGKIRNSRTIGPMNMKLIIKRMDTIISHERGLKAPHIFVFVMAA